MTRPTHFENAGGALLLVYEDGTTLTVHDSLEDAFPEPFPEHNPEPNNQN